MDNFTEEDIWKWIESGLYDHIKEKRLNHYPSYYFSNNLRDCFIVKKAKKYYHLNLNPQACVPPEIYLEVCKIRDKIKNFDYNKYPKIRIPYEFRDGYYLEDPPEFKNIKQTILYDNCSFHYENVLKIDKLVIIDNDGFIHRKNTGPSIKKPISSIFLNYDKDNFYICVYNFSIDLSPSRTITDDQIIIMNEKLRENNIYI